MKESNDVNARILLQDSQPSEDEDRIDLEEAMRRLSEVKEEELIPFDEVRKKAGLL